MKLELKHLAPYLPYGLNMKIYHPEHNFYPNGEDRVLELDCGHDFHFHLSNGNVKPILRPLSDLEEYFEDLYGSLEHQDVTDYLDTDFLDSMDFLAIEEIQHTDVNYIPYGTLQVLLKHHFDVFGLIPQGLAIDKNSLK